VGETAARQWQARSVLGWLRALQDDERADGENPKSTMPLREGRLLLSAVPAFHLLMLSGGELACGYVKAVSGERA